MYMACNAAVRKRLLLLDLRGGPEQDARASYSNCIAIYQCSSGYLMSFNECAVCRAHIARNDAFICNIYLKMMAGNSRIVNDYVAVGSAPQDSFIRCKAVLAAVVTGAALPCTDSLISL